MSDLVVAPSDSTTWHTALGPVDSFASMAEAAGRGDWAEATLDVALGGLDTLGTIANPVASLVSAGVGWVIEHFEPLNSWLDELAGDPDQITAFAQTWGNIGNDIHHNASHFRDTVSTDLAPWSGPAVEAYRAASGVQASVIDGFAVMTQGVGEAVRVAGSIVGAVRAMVRDAISDLVGMAVEKIPELLSIVGAPFAIEGIVAKVSQWVAKVSTFVKNLVRSMGRLGEVLTDIAHGLKSAGTSIRSIAKDWDDLPINKGLSPSEGQLPTRAYLAYHSATQYLSDTAARDDQ